MSKGLTFTKLECIWIRDLIRADISEWQEHAARPVDEIGVLFADLAKKPH